MPESTVRLPPDGSGKALHTRQRTVAVAGSDTTVEEQYVLALLHDRVVSGRYSFHTGVHVVLAAAETTTNGRWFLYNPGTSTVLVAVREIVFRSQHGTLLATPTSPRIAIKLLTGASGDLSASLVTPAKHRSSQPAHTVKASTANTGISTPAAGAVVATFLPVAALTAVGASAPAESVWRREADNPLILAANEGIFCQQIDAGTTSDTRRYTIDVVVDEFTEP